MDSSHHPNHLIRYTMKASLTEMLQQLTRSCCHPPWSINLSQVMEVDFTHDFETVTVVMRCCNFLSSPGEQFPSCSPLQIVATLLIEPCPLEWKWTPRSNKGCRFLNSTPKAPFLLVPRQQNQNRKGYGILDPDLIQLVTNSKEHKYLLYKGFY